MFIIQGTFASVGAGPPPPGFHAETQLACSWYNLLCQGGEAVAGTGLSAITKSIAGGASMLLGEITKILDESSQVPLTDPTYRDIYYGFLGLAVPLIAAVLCGALVVAGIRRDPGTLGRAIGGIVVATIGGALYIVFAQLLIAVDNYLSHGIVRVTGHDLTDAIAGIAEGFKQISGSTGEIAANMLLIILMMIMLIAGLGLWFVLVLRKIAILVVVAFAPLLIAGWLWAPTRSWVRRATETLVALIFTKSAIFALFGIGLALLFRDDGQSVSDFVGAVVLLCGACFAPLVMLKLVHFAADSHVAGEMMGTLRGGMQPVMNRIPSTSGAHRPMGRSDMARQYGGGASPKPAVAGQIQPGASAGGDAAAPTPALAGAKGASANPGAMKAGTSGAAGGAAGAGGAIAGGAAAAVGTAVEATKQVSSKTASGVDALTDNTSERSRRSQIPPTEGPRMPGPTQTQPPGDHNGGQP